VTTMHSVLVPVYIPLGLHSGTKYRLRTWSASPPIVGSINDSNITLRPLPLAKMNPTGDLDLCENDTLTLTATGGERYLWSTGDTTAQIKVAKEGSYAVTVVGSNGCDVKLPPAKVALRLLPPVPAVSRRNDSLVAYPFPGLRYQWYFNGAYIPDATQNGYFPTRNGTYNVLVMSQYKCISVSDDIIINDLNDAVLDAERRYSLTLTNETIQIVSDQPLPASIEVRDILGRLIASDSRFIAVGVSEIPIVLSNAPTGPYYLTVRTPRGLSTFNIIHVQP
jgi:hypothetical protein